ncbi:MAG: hypothetical protein IT564_09305 [Rhodospirillales bacterium]|nr:hypothetical protein [Rhodospirillales bacterium]
MAAISLRAPCEKPLDDRAFPFSWLPQIIFVAFQGSSIDLEQSGGLFPRQAQLAALCS